MSTTTLRFAVWTIFVALFFSTPAPAKPNIIVIFTDDQDDTGSMAYMPKTLESLAKQGVTFTNSFVNHPLCAPSRASLFTGQAEHNHGITANSKGMRIRAREESTLPVWLQAAGYQTALLGKYINGYGKQNKSAKSCKRKLGWLPSIYNYLGISDSSAAEQPPPGWNLWYAFTGGITYYNYAINDNGHLLCFGDKPSNYSTDVLKNRAVAFIKDQKPDRPFFMLVSTKAVHGQEVKGEAKRGEEDDEPEGNKGHGPVPAPGYQQSLTDVMLPKGPAFGPGDRNGGRAHFDPDLLQTEYRQTLQALQSVDDLVQDIIHTLAEKSLLENSVIIYTSDNGMLFGDHGIRGKNSFYEGSIKVPLLVRGPGIPKNEKRDELVNNLDVVATIVSLAGAKPNVDLDGRSLEPLVVDAKAPWRSALLMEIKEDFGVRTRSQKYVKHAGGSEQFFDLAADPYELKDKADEPGAAGDLASLRAIGDKLKTCKASSCWVP